jgi:hypothetical protein
MEAFRKTGGAFAGCDGERLLATTIATHALCEHHPETGHGSYAQLALGSCQSGHENKPVIPMTIR